MWRESQKTQAGFWPEHPRPTGKQSSNMQGGLADAGYSARGGIRTRTGLPPGDFKSQASTSFATRAGCGPVIYPTDEPYPADSVSRRTPDAARVLHTAGARPNRSPNPLLISATTRALRSSATSTSTAPPQPAPVSRAP
jgi:hypothetical protein